MNRHAQLATTLVLLLSCAGADARAERQLYVSPTGDDAAPGSREAPFQTLHRAQEAAREAAPGMSADVVVNISASADLDLTASWSDTTPDEGQTVTVSFYLWNNGPDEATNITAQATAKSVIASAKRLIEVRHFCRSRKRIAEIRVPA